MAIQKCRANFFSLRRARKKHKRHKDSKFETFVVFVPPSCSFEVKTTGCPNFLAHYNFGHGNGCRVVFSPGDRFVSSDVSSRLYSTSPTRPIGQFATPQAVLPSRLYPLTCLCNGALGNASVRFRASPHHSVALLQSSAQEQVTHRLDYFLFLPIPFYSFLFALLSFRFSLSCVSG
jgi:hypothetical protein